MIYILGILQLIFCLIILFFEYKNKSISLFFWAVILLLFCLPHMLEILVGVSLYSKEVFNISSLFVIFFEIIYFFTRLIISPQRYKSIISDLEMKKTSLEEKNNKLIFKRIIKMNILVFLIFLFYFIFRFGTISNLSWGELYQASINTNNLFDKILELLKSFNHILFFAVTGLLVTSIYKNKKKSYLFIIFLILFYSMITRNRIALLPLLISLILIFIMKNEKLKLKQVITFGALGILCVYIVYAIWIFRHAGTLENFMSMYNFSTFNEEVFNSILNGDGELSLRKIYYHFISINNNFPGLSTGATYIRLLLMFIPSSLCFGIKPSDFAITMSSAYTGNLYNTNYSVHPTFFGDLFANFNFYGIFFGIFWALFFLVLDKYIVKKNYVTRNCLLVTWGTCFVIMARGSVYNAVFIGVFSTIILAVLTNYKITLNGKE